MESKYLAFAVSVSGLILAAVGAWGLTQVGGVAWVTICGVLSGCGLATAGLGIVLHTRDLIEEEPLFPENEVEYLPFRSA